MKKLLAILALLFAVGATPALAALTEVQNGVNQTQASGINIFPNPGTFTTTAGNLLFGFLSTNIAGSGSKTADIADAENGGYTNANAPTDNNTGNVNSMSAYVNNSIALAGEYAVGQACCQSGGPGYYSNIFWAEISGQSTTIPVDIKTVVDIASTTTPSVTGTTRATNERVYCMLTMDDFGASASVSNLNGWTQDYFNNLRNGSPSMWVGYKDVAVAGAVNCNPVFSVASVKQGQLVSFVPAGGSFGSTNVSGMLLHVGP
jgi:hypothetical protein